MIKLKLILKMLPLKPMRLDLFTKVLELRDQNILLADSFGP